MIEEFWYGHLLHEYYVQRVRAISTEREKSRAGVRTRGQVMHLRGTVRRRLRACFGAFPSRTPLNGRVTGIVDRPHYKIERVIFESRPRLLVTANLYLRKGRQPPFPAILHPCGHSPNAKADRQTQSLCQS